MCATLAVRTHGKENVAAVSFLYGQKHTKEVDAAMKVSTHFGIKWHSIIGLPLVFKGYGSAIMSKDQQEMPQMTYQEIHNAQGVSPTYVPYRNGNLLSISATIALTLGADELYFGAHSEDAHNWAYPDCTPEFIGAMANAIFIGTYYKVRLRSPLMWMTKKDVVKMGLQYGAPFELTWSCYEGGELSCGKCPTCVSRLEAFKVNGTKDPAQYPKEIDQWWTLNPLPKVYGRDPERAK